MTARKSPARFRVTAAPFHRPTLVNVVIQPLGERSALLVLRRHRSRQALELPLAEVVELLLERSALRAAAERARAKKAARAGQRRPRRGGAR